MKDNLIRNILIISVVLIGVAVSIGFSFAYFTAKIEGNDGAELMTVTAGTMELTFKDNPGINLDSNAKPGSTDSKIFSVQNTGTLDKEYNYNIKLVDVDTNFKKRDLKYTLEECNDSACSSLKDNGLKEEGYINTDSVQNKEMYIAVDIPRPANQQYHYYKLTITFQELNMNQNYNQGAHFSGKVNVDAEEEMKVYVQKANAPELYQGMIPVYFEEGKIYIADASKDDWYDYENNEWGNAILIDYQSNKDKFYEGEQLKVGEKVEESDILQMYVWIPRYRYKLFNADNQVVPKQIIEIEFEKDTETTGNVSCTINNLGEETCKNAEVGSWYTHPAFTFGNTELKGFWVGKFEPSDSTDETGYNLNAIGEITIIPNKVSMVRKRVDIMFNTSRSIETTSKYGLSADLIDTHMMKNMEWGAVAYLTNSKYGRCIGNLCENVWINNTNFGNASGWKGTITGCSATEEDSAFSVSTNKCDNGRMWSEEGVKASTTGNMYGIYDMRGGVWEYVMGVVTNEKGVADLENTGFHEMPQIKYYDAYSQNNLGSIKHLGDGMDFTIDTRLWILRGGNCSDGAGATIFSSYPALPTGGTYTSFRVVITAQDGNS